MHIILFVVVFGVGIFLLLRGTTPAPPVMLESELEQEGLTPLQIRRELRAQRQEARSHSNTKSQAARAANTIAKSVYTMSTRSRRVKR
jgi:hypothetical protein